MRCISELCSVRLETPNMLNDANDRNPCVANGTNQSVINIYIDNHTRVWAE